MKRALLASFLFIAAGCGLDRRSNEAYCESKEDCASGEECVPLAAGATGGLCVAVQRAAGGKDAGIDAGLDAARPTDAGHDGGGETADAGSDAGADAGTDASCEPCFADTIPDGGMNVGACTPGCLVATDAGEVCVGAGAPSSETCNGLDDDCDGETDEEFDLTTTSSCGGCGLSCETGLNCCNRGRVGEPASYECTSTTSDVRACGGCGIQCNLNETCCNSDCVDVMEDEANCGACNNPCDAGQTCCGGVCVDGARSISHCGASPATGCGTACPPLGDGGDAACCSGVCRAPGDAACGCPGGCDADETCCSGACVDADSDPQHCGACGASCGANERCCGGVCTPVDDLNCAGCGVACAAGSRCCDGACTPIGSTNCEACGTGCSGGNICCDGACVNTQTDDDNCGGCDVECTGASSNCSNGVCCAPNRLNCGSGCMAPNNTHCTACNQGCPPLCTCTAGGTCVFIIGGGAC